MKRRLGLLGMILVFAGPFLFLAADALRVDWPGLAELFSARRLTLLSRSVGLALAVCTGSLVLALVTALGFYGRRPPRWLFPGLTLAMVFVPPYVYAQAFIFFFDLIFQGTRLNFNGFWAAVASLSAAFAPLPCVLLYESMRAIPRPVLEAAGLYAPPRKVLWRVVLPLSLKGVAGAVAAVFLLSFSDFTVPSVFGVNTYALDILAEYSATFSAGRVFLHALPTLIFAVLIALPATKAVRGLVLSPPKPNQDGIGLGRSLFWPACGVGFLLVALPVINLFAHWGGPGVFAGVVAGSLSELGNSLILAGLSLPPCLLLAVVGGGLIARGGRALSNACVFVLMLPLITPAGLVGIAGVTAMKALGFTNTLAAPVLVLALRYAPLGALILAGFLGGMDQNLLDAWLISRRGATHGLIKVLLPLIRPGLLAAGACMLSFAMADVATTLLCVPPGMNTLTIKIYNYLHYGSSETVAGLCLIMLAVSLLLSIPARRMLGQTRSPK